jgi:hypothetical protein
LAQQTIFNRQPDPITEFSASELKPGEVAITVRGPEYAEQSDIGVPVMGATHDIILFITQVAQTDLADGWYVRRLYPGETVTITGV